MIKAEESKAVKWETVGGGGSLGNQWEWILRGHLSDTLTVNDDVPEEEREYPASRELHRHHGELPKKIRIKKTDDPKYGEI